ncbi:MAG: FecR domain-containing protein [Bacteroidota bacterium]
MSNELNPMQDDLIIRHLTGETSAEEENQLLIWRTQLPENERYYNGMKEIFALSSKHYSQRTNEQLNINVDEEWGQFVKTITKKVTPVRPIIPESPFRLWLKIAAALLVVVVSGVVINYIVFRKTDIQFQTADQTLSITLPEGSIITLNQHSQLSYASTFGEKNRNVSLKGEGFFEVKRDVQKPFVIKVEQGTVEVLGTSFNVQSYDHRKEIEVTVQTGSVRFSVPETKREVKLTAGQKGIYSKTEQSLIGEPNDDLNFLSWNTRKIVFVESELESVIETLNETYQVNIVLPADIPKTCLVTVTFDHQTLEAVLNVLRTTLNLTYTIKGNQIEITRVGC